MPTLVGNWHDERCPVLSVVLLILNLCCSSVLVLFLVVLALLVVCNGRGWVPSHGCCCCHSCSWAVAATADALVTGAVPAEAAPVSLVTAVFLIVFLLTLLMSVLLEILYRFTLKPTSNPTPLWRIFLLPHLSDTISCSNNICWKFWWVSLVFHEFVKKNKCNTSPPHEKNVHPLNLSKNLRDCRGWFLGGYMLNFRGVNSQGSWYYQPTQWTKKKWKSLKNHLKFAFFDHDPPPKMGHK